jgi:hypothetical protein
MSTEQQIQFDLGQTVATPGALEALRRNNTSGLEYLQRHASGDWGMVGEEDRQANNDALKSGARLLSAYFLPDETKLWIITEAADEHGRRIATTFLLPEEY